MIISVLMAGGKGKRLNADVEKPLFKFKDKPLIDYVLKNLSDSKYVEKIVVATSPHTTETKNYIENFLSNSNKVNKSFCSLIETPGDGYLDDLSFLLSTFEEKSDKDTLVFINADLPFVSAKTIDFVLEEYMKNNRPAMSVLVPIDIFDKYGIEPSYTFENSVPSGLNILISQNKVQNEEKLIIPDVELALNINTIEDIKLANYIYENIVI
jgi:adenosylcobinamide-phosphate guanylyltransferase